VCVVDASNEDGCEPSVKVGWKLCRVHLCRRGEKLVVKEARPSFLHGHDEGRMDTEVEVLQSKAYVVVSARRFVERERAWDEFVARLDDLNGLDDLSGVEQWGRNIAMAQRISCGVIGGTTDVRCEGWNSVDGNQAFEEGLSLGKREFFHTSWP
jgi:hypothetical protein